MPAYLPYKVNVQTVVNDIQKTGEMGSSSNMFAETVHEMVQKNTTTAPTGKKKSIFMKFSMRK